MTLTPPQWTTPTDYRNLMRLRRALPAPILHKALGTLFEDIDLHTLAVRGTHLARRAPADTAAAAELAAIARVLAEVVASPSAARVTTTIATLRTRIGHIHRNGFELLMFAYRDLLDDPCARHYGADAQAAAPAHPHDTHWNEAAAS
ncbi:hypothetical protein HBA53_25240 (plasmid) [Rhodococcus pyridinivorans]|uniref:hypothetical protein n=1 Tax=Rhodococcus pyridinivorans TaxID=103816 RepID=UPI001C3020B2|nr:hypothetical protein [Rhodococcus pyridinivorans]QXF84386.1 hypothetical protein HBA53_25240 [Rhodococcus pyridinivorans]